MNNFWMWWIIGLVLTFLGLGFGAADIPVTSYIFYGFAFLAFTGAAYVHRQEHK